MSHPNVLPVRDMVDVNGQPGLVLPLVEGPSLRQLLSRTRVTEPQGITLFRGIAAGVRHAHGLGLVHRDLKPGNVLLEPRWGRIIPRVCDFGLVKMLEGADTLTATGAMMGTLNYIAPEQLRDAAGVDHRADLFSLGVMLVELLTGHRPFDASSFYSLLQAYEQPPYLDGLPAAWVPLACALLAPEPADRIADSAALAVWLDELAPDGDDSLRIDGPFGQRVRDASDDTAEPSVPATLSVMGTSLSPPHNLAPEPDSFIGRGAALTALAELVAAGARLITILGVGGIGKTRLAQRFARAHLLSCPGGAWFCDLSDVQDVDGVVYTLAHTLAIAVNRSSPVQALGRSLSNLGPCVIILDNTEQIVDPTVSLLREWRALAPEVLFLVTSRTVLGAPGERLLPLEPLEPAAARTLFLSRAQALKPGFVPQDEEEQAAIAELMVLLDGMPLAVELAAARIRIMRPRRMCQRMSERFRLLGDRQRSLQATIDWSWALLSDGEKATLAQCSLFEGGFTLEAAEAVVDLSAQPGAPWVMDAVQSLVDKSLLRAQHRRGELRLDTFLSIRAYAADKLLSPGVFPGSGQALAGAGRRAHAAHYFSLISPTPSRVSERPEDMAMLALEVSNFSAACRRSVADGQPKVATRGYVVLAQLFLAQGPLATGVALGEEVLASSALSAVQRVQIQNMLAQFGYKLSRIDVAAENWAAALSSARVLNRRDLIAMVCIDMSEMCRQNGQHDQARQLIEEGYGLAEQIGDPHLLIRGTRCLGRLEEDPEKAYHHLLRGLSLAQQHRAPFEEQAIQIALGDWFRDRGDLDAAWQAFEAARELAHRLGNQQAEGAALTNLGTIYQRSGRYTEARDSYRAALEIARRMGSLRSITISQYNLASILWSLGDVEAAVPMFDAVRKAAEGSGTLKLILASHNALGSIAAQRGDLAEARHHFEVTLAQTEATELPLKYSPVLAKLAALALREGDLEEAQRLAARGMGLVRTANRSDGQVAFFDLLVRIAQARGDAAETTRLLRAQEACCAALKPAHIKRILKANARILGALS